MGDEIERKFLPKELPDMRQCEKKEIVQGYLTVGENSSVRVRNMDDKYFLTFKSGRGRKRRELEPELTKSQFDELWPGTEGTRVVKTRHYVPEDKNKVEVNVYHGRLEGLVLFEVEFQSDEDCEKFVPPSWFGKEVTDNPKFLDMNLSLYGINRIAELPKFQYELDDGLARLILAVEDRLSSQERIVVNVAGGTSSGKTYAVASKLKACFGNKAVLISMDDYYRGNEYISAQRAEGKDINWDMPDALNLELLAEHLQMLKRSKSVQKPIYSFKTGEPIGSENVSPARVIIVEGLFALNSSVVSDSDIRAYVDVSTHGMLLRRLFRDVHRTSQKPSDILKYFVSTVLPMHEQHVASTRVNADLVICNEYRPEVEAQRSGMYEVQLKFKKSLDRDKLREIGAEHIGFTKQQDHYFKPRNNASDEVIRIRTENGRFLLGYKGPRVDSEVRKRPKFEFEIDEETKQSVKSLYDEPVMAVHKDRNLYVLDGVVFSLDERVYKFANSSAWPLGDFVEIRSTVDDDRVKKLVSKLGLSLDDKVTASYLDM
jgi:predicted adenylyl cyclase CyaB